MINKVKNWIAKDRKEVFSKTKKRITHKIGQLSEYFKTHNKNIVRRFFACIFRISRNISRIYFSGCIFKVIVKFCPEILQECPTICAAINGTMQFIELIFKVSLKCLYSLFNGNIFNYIHGECSANFQEILNQFLTWISSI